ncbi:MAG: tetratricopeptide repeat protein, partial [Bacteroidetes bacterium]|nr:tetratricopeptide repeat protein [Bacteroidota bacterium]
MIRLRPLLFVCIFAATGAGSAVRAQGPTENLDSGNPRTQALFVKALTEAYLGDHEQAVLLFTNVLSTQPGEPAVLAALAESYIALGQPAEALFYAAEAVEHGRNEPSYYTTLAELQAELNQPDAAISTYSALLSLSPRDAEALAALGLLQEQSGQFEEALATYVQLISAAGETIALRLRMEALHARLGNTEEALRMLELAADASRNEPMIQFRLGMAYRDTGRTSDAIHILERYLTLLALATLCGGLPASAPALVDTTLVGVLPSDTALWLETFRLIAGTDSRSGYDLAPLEPDLLGECFVLERWDEIGSRLGGRILGAAWRHAPHNSAIFVLRSTRDFPAHPALRALQGVADETPESRWWWSALAADLVGVYGKAGNLDRASDFVEELRDVAHRNPND